MTDTKTSEMVERVGLALLNDDRTRNGWPAVDALTHLIDRDAAAYRESARAAIEAMREPTQEMLRATSVSQADQVTDRAMSQAMVDEALR